MSEAKSNVLELSVSEISQTLKRMVEDNFAYVRIRGEISGYRGPHSSGHAYFALKDPKARMDAVVWRGVMSKLRFKPEEGMEVIATGKLSTFPGSSRYQIIIERLEPAGVGALMAMLEARKKKLAAEGLFEQDRKKPLPFLPKTIGVITSPTGAVIRDIMHRINDRFPCHVVIWPVRVQGDSCAAEVTAAIEGFDNLSDDRTQNVDQMPRPDLLIVARGGGSIEDLWGFNEENVARATANCGIPIISAIGHETDTTLIDFVSDKRAPTPTAAAEMAVPIRRELELSISEKHHRLNNGLSRLLDQKHQHLLTAKRGLPKSSELLLIPAQKLDQAIMRLGGALTRGTGQKRNQFERIAGRLSARPLMQNVTSKSQHVEQLSARMKQSLTIFTAQKKTALHSIEKLLNSYSYKSVLERGFALVMTKKGKSLKSIQKAKPGELINIRLADGVINAKIGDDNVENANLDVKKAIKTAKKTQKISDNGQGNLFD